MDTELGSLRQQSMTPVEFAQELWIKTLSLRSAYDKKSVKGLFVEGVTHQFHKTLRHRCAEHQHASLKDLSKKEELLLNLNKRPEQKHTINSKQPGYRSAHRNINTEKGRC